MKSAFRIAFVLVLFSTFTASPARAFQAQILALSCASLSPGMGATSVVYSGVFAGGTYLNITNVGMWGIPFTQQALVEAIEPIGGRSVRLRLRAMITGGSLFLTLMNNGTQGYLSESRSHGGIEMNCMAQIQ